MRSSATESWMSRKERQSSEMMWVNSRAGWKLLTKWIKACI